MKRFLFILLLWVALWLVPERAPAQYVPTNQVNILMTSSSYGMPPYFFWERYNMAWWASMYPQWTNGVYDIGLSGHSWEDDWTNRWEAWVMPYMALAPSPVEVWIMPEDNGNYGSNSIVQFGTNFISSPPIWWNGVNKTNEGSVVTQPVQYYFLGGIIADSEDQTLPASRQAGSTYLNSLLGITDIPLFLTVSNKWAQDRVGNRDLGFWPGAHPYPPGHFAMHAFILRARNVETNVASFVVNFNAGTISTNHCVVSGITATPIKVSWTLHYDRMPGGIDFLDGVHTNDATKATNEFPELRDWNRWIVQATNLPHGTYIYKNDGEEIFRATDAQLAAGVNQYMITNGWIGRQRYAVLDACCGVMGCDPITMQPTHDAGSFGVHGVWDDINYKSRGGFFFSTQKGQTLVDSMASSVGAMRTNQFFVWQAAQQTNHTASLELITTVVGEEAAITMPDDARYYRIMGFSPGSNYVSDLNPPIFQWLYGETPQIVSSNFLRQFRFQLATNATFSPTYWDISCSNNFYNFLPPITNSDGSKWAGTNYWRVIYYNSNSSSVVATSAVYNFTLSQTASNWDRSMLANTNYLLSICSNSPHMWFNAGNRLAMSNYLMHVTWPMAIRNWLNTTNSAAQAMTNSWWGNSTVTNNNGSNLLAAITGAQAVAGIYYLTGSNAFWDINGACATLSYAATGFQQQGWDLKDPYDIDTGAEQEMAIGYDWMKPFFTTAQKSNVLYELKALVHYQAYGAAGGNAAYLRSTPAVTNRIYTNALDAPFFGAYKLNSSHARLGTGVATMICIATMADDPEMLGLFQLFANYSIFELDPNKGDEGRGYSQSANFKFDRQFAANALCAVQFPEAQLWRNPLLTNLCNQFAQWQPVGYKDVFEPWGDLNYGQPSPWYHFRFYDVAIMTGNGAILRQYRRQLPLKTSNPEEFPMLGEIFLTYYFPAPAETDWPNNYFVEPKRGWAMWSSYPSTDYRAFTNGCGYILQARPAGTRGEHSSMTDGAMDAWAYGAQIGQGGAAGGYAKHPMYYNGLMVRGVGVNNPNMPPSDPILSRLLYFETNSACTYAAADITLGMNRGNGNPTGLGDVTTSFYNRSSNFLTDLSLIRRHAVTPHNQYLVLYDQMQTTSPEKFQWIWHIAQTNYTVDTNNCAFVFNATNTWNGSNVAVYVQHIVNPSLMAITNIYGTNLAKFNPFTGENYMGVDGDTGPFMGGSVWAYNKTATTNWHFLSVLFPVKWDDTNGAPTITRITDNTVRIQQGTVIDDVVSFGETNASPPSTIVISTLSAPPITTGGGGNGGNGDPTTSLYSPFFMK
jgi:hypothetical protein